MGLRKITIWILSASATLVLAGCQTYRTWVDRREGASEAAPYGYIPRQEYDQNSTAAGAAYAAEHFSWHVPSPSRPKNNYEFYYKRCERNGVDTPFMLKIEWACSESPL